MPARVVSGRSQPKIVIVGMGARFGGEAWTAVEERTGAELAALGLNVVRVQSRVADLEARLAELGTQAAEHHAIAAVRIVRRGGRRAVEVWIYDALTRKMVLRKATLASSGNAAEDAALQVVELLNASLIEVRIARKAALGQRVPRQVEALVARQLDKPTPGQREAAAPPRWHLAGAVAVLSLGQELDAVGALALSLRYSLTRSISIRTELVATPFSSRLEDPRGQASVHGGMLRLSGLYAPWSGARVSPSILISAGSLLVRAGGESTAQSVGQVEWSAVALADLGLQLAVRLTPSLKLIASASLGVTFPRVHVRFDEDLLATAGWPLVGGQLGLQWSWGRR